LPTHFDLGKKHTTSLLGFMNTFRENDQITVKDGLESPAADGRLGRPKGRRTNFFQTEKYFTPAAP
jgi:hypothetical protein